MKPTFKKIASSFVVVILVIAGGLFSLIAFPQTLFAYSFSHKNFTVHSDYDIDNRIANLLDRAICISSTSELYDTAVRFKVLLAHGNILNNVDDLQGKDVAGRAAAGNIVIKVLVDLENDLAFSKRNQIRFTELLVHEMIHILQTRKYGMLRFNPWLHPPMWKLEGYPEYIARHRDRLSKGYDLRNEIERDNKLSSESTDGWVEVSARHSMPSIYYKGRIMIEYLIDINGYTYDQILNDETSEDEIFADMVDWAKRPY